jgi:hypothetical protein
MLRVCSRCSSEEDDVEMLGTSTPVEETRKESEESDEEEGEGTASKRARTEASNTCRTVLTYKQKGEILTLLDQKFTQATIAKRYKVSSLPRATIFSCCRH